MPFSFTCRPLKSKLTILWQGYSWEITTPEGGNGLHELLSSRKSVLNGMTMIFEVIGNILVCPWFLIEKL